MANPLRAWDHRRGCRGYNDYRLFAEWTDAGVYFVTRMKDNAQFEVVEEREPLQNRNILKEQTIRLTGTGAQETCPHLLRRLEAVRGDTGDRLVFLTNHHGLGARTIAAIDKDRWQIELFFKALKQNLKIKPFVGTSVNAVEDSDVDRIDLDAVAALSATVLPFRLERGESCGAAAHASLYPSRSDGLARRTVHHVTSSMGPPPNPLALRVILDGTRRHERENPSSPVRNPHQITWAPPGLGYLGQQ